MRSIFRVHEKFSTIDIDYFFSGNSSKNNTVSKTILMDLSLMQTKEGKRWRQRMKFHTRCDIPKSAERRQGKWGMCARARIVKIRKERKLPTFRLYSNEGKLHAALPPCFIALEPKPKFGKGVLTTNLLDSGKSELICLSQPAQYLKEHEIDNPAYLPTTSKQATRHLPNFLLLLPLLRTNSVRDP